MLGRRPSLSLVAEKAGVSPATVSRVLNHRDLVRPETVLKIEAAMELLNYSAAPIRTPSDGKGLIIINVPPLDNPFYGEILRGINSCAESHGYHTLISQHSLTSSAVVEDFASLIRRTKAVGVILLSSLDPDYYGQVSVLAPMVQCCEYNTKRFSYVSVDDYRATLNVMEHIYSTGHRKVAFLNGPSTFKYARERSRGYEAFHQIMGVSLRPDWILQLPEVNFDMAFAAVSQLLSSDDPPDAVFAVSDLMAAAVIKAAKLRRLKVPDDLVVVGFDNIFASAISDPAITTVNQPKFQLGYTSCEVLHKHITGPAGPACLPQHILLDTELIIRESSSWNAATF